MAGKKERELVENIKSLQQNIELVSVPEVIQKAMEHKMVNTTPKITASE